MNNINIDNLFYDHVDECKVVMTECIDNVKNNLVYTMIRFIKESSIIESLFYRSFVELCRTSILGYDSLYQSTLFSIISKL